MVVVTGTCSILCVPCQLQPENYHHHTDHFQVWARSHISVTILPSQISRYSFPLPRINQISSQSLPVSPRDPEQPSYPTSSLTHTGFPQYPPPSFSFTAPAITRCFPATSIPRWYLPGGISLSNPNKRSMLV